MRMRVVLVLTATIAVCSSLPVQAQTPAARAWADSTSFLVGDPITVHVELTHNEKEAFTPLVGDTLGAFHILGRGDLKRTSSTLSRADFIVAAYDSGTAILPPLQFALTSQRDTSTQIVATNPLIFKIHLVEVDTSQGIKDLKPPLCIPFTVAEISLIIGTLIGIALLVYSAYQYRKRKKERVVEEEYIPPPKLAHVQALEELAALKEKRLWQQGLIKPYYSEVTEVIRRYFEHRFGFMSLEQTTDETMDNLRRFAVAHPVLEQTDRMLHRADLVKFAKYQPSIPEHEEMLTLAFEIVDRTKVVEQPAVEEREIKEAAHV